MNRAVRSIRRTLATLAYSVYLALLPQEDVAAQRRVEQYTSDEGLPELPPVKPNILNTCTICGQLEHPADRTADLNLLSWQYHWNEVYKQLRSSGASKHDAYWAAHVGMTDVYGGRPPVPWPQETDYQVGDGRGTDRRS